MRARVKRLLGLERVWQQLVAGLNGGTGRERVGAIELSWLCGRRTDLRSRSSGMIT